MNKFCNKPDRDVASLTCGYPLPCPHHSFVLTQENLDLGIATLRWLRGKPSILIHAEAVVSDIVITAVAMYCGESRWRGQRILPLTAPMAELRDAYDELTREGHLELEKCSIPTFEAKRSECAKLDPHLANVQCTVCNGLFCNGCGEPGDFSETSNVLRIAYTCPRCENAKNPNPET